MAYSENADESPGGSVIEYVVLDTEGITRWANMATTLVQGNPPSPTEPRRFLPAELLSGRLEELYTGSQADPEEQPSSQPPSTTGSGSDDDFGVTYHGLSGMWESQNALRDLHQLHPEVMASGVPGASRRSPLRQDILPQISSKGKAPTSPRKVVFALPFLVLNCG